jgi:ribose 1,5-bisphosphokinase PhnN
MLRERYSATIIKTRDLIRKQLPNVKEERGALQRAGEKLDKADGGVWVKNSLVRFIEDNVGGPAATGFFVIDSARIPGQVTAIREAYGTAVHHIHVHASDDVLAKRYAERDGRTKEFERYEDVRRNKTEREVRKLVHLADTVVATDRCTPEAVLVRSIALLGFYPRVATPLRAGHDKRNRFGRFANVDRGSSCLGHHAESPIARIGNRDCDLEGCGAIDDGVEVLHHHWEVVLARGVRGDDMQEF